MMTHLSTQSTAVKADECHAIASTLAALLPQDVTAKVSQKDNCLKIMLESVEVPDRDTLVDIVREAIAGLNPSKIKQAKVYGREIAEDFPNWQEEFEINVHSALNITSLAKKGDIEALHTLFAQWLSNADITAKISLKNACLRVMLEASTFSDVTALTSNLLQNVLDLAIENCVELKISGREPGEEFPDWQKEFNLSPFSPADGSELPSTVNACLDVPPQIATASVSLLELARQGDSQAITQAINSLVDGKGWKVAANLKQNCLLIAISAELIPDKESTIAHLLKVLDGLKLPLVKAAKIYAYERDVTLPSWDCDLNLEKSDGGNFFGSIFGAVGSVGCHVANAGGAVLGAVSNVAGQTGQNVVNAGGAVLGAVAEVTGAVSNVAGQTVTQTATGFVEAAGNTAMQTPNSIGFALDAIGNSPQLQHLTKALKVDWLVAIVEKVDIVKAETHVKNLQRKYPQEQASDIAHRLMVEKALYVGGSGFATSLIPGFASAMFAVDLAGTMALQAEMIYQIAAAYGMNLHEPARKGEVLAIFGVSMGTKTAIKAGLSLARHIPVAGAVIGASTNAAMLYGLGYAACRFYETARTSSSSATNLLASQAESEKYLQSALDRQIIMDLILVHMVMAGNPHKNLQQLLPELERIELNAASLDVIKANPKALMPLETLLDRLDRDFAASLNAQCQKIAQSDGVITPQEAEIIKAIAGKFGSIL